MGSLRRADLDSELGNFEPRGIRFGIGDISMMRSGSFTNLH